MAVDAGIADQPPEVDDDDWQPRALGIKCPECGVGPGDDCRTRTGGSYMALSGGSDVSGIERGLHFACMDEWIRLVCEYDRSLLEGVALSTPRRQQRAVLQRLSNSRSRKIWVKDPEALLNKKQGRKIEDRELKNENSN